MKPDSSLSAAPLVAIVGGGPAGLLAAQRLAEAGLRVRVFEQKATVGRKFLVAGHGGFNLTNGEDAAAFAGRYGGASAFFRGLLAHFSPGDLRRWAADLGIATFVGTSGRVFPEARHKPADLLRAWLRRLGELGVEINVRHRWLGFAGEAGLRLLNEASGEEFTLEPAATVLALGGASWPQTGSDGHWVPLLAGLGVACQPWQPANCGAEVAWSVFFKEKVGRAPLKNIALSCGEHTVRGELMLTDYGLEGTPVYALTPALRTALAAGGLASLHLNLKPDLAPAELARRLAQRRPGTSLAAFLAGALGLKAPVPTLLRELAAPGADLGASLTALPIAVAGLRTLAEAISSAGGVPFSEVTENLMLRRGAGTFVAGEMLDWEAPTGGYLLQGCFSTGAWAAAGVRQWLGR
ncbi:BaiN/RdsA family NAD(P)/FAD-dependent oxidoreductase [Hymenobacter cheonanensis]|uniref:NAD(P)/FAD-dependent oxidoreductase n=1 Tax=Hymenobacter sp. CA2-7 TaxID=3063993 RepID=UPI002712D809|nr:TIGR03862 family flavoprotein [Hymenobacter sp. CA2-7]MDO7884153.1 TIGR03862 family flavoprotein [Hymenobacter sp. CA2-7]